MNNIEANQPLRGSSPIEGSFQGVQEKKVKKESLVDFLLCIKNVLNPAKVIHPKKPITQTGKPVTHSQEFVERSVKNLQKTEQMLASHRKEGLKNPSISKGVTFNPQVSVIKEDVIVKSTHLRSLRHADENGVEEVVNNNFVILNAAYNKISGRTGENVNKLKSEIVKQLDSLNKLKKLYDQALDMPQSKNRDQKINQYLNKILQISGKTHILLEVVEADHVADNALKRIKEFKLDQKGEFLMIDKGAAKSVWIKLEGDDKAVYYSPVRNIFEKLTHAKEAEIKKEVDTARNIQSNLLKKEIPKLIHQLAEGHPESVPQLASVLDKIQKADTATMNQLVQILNSRFDPVAFNYSLNMSSFPDDLKEFVRNNLEQLASIGGHLALDYKGIDNNKIDDQYTVRTLKAEGRSLEKYILRKVEDKKASFQETARFGQEFLNGMAEMHAAGYVHGDMKLDNILVYENKNESGVVERHVKISDFGKTRPIEENASEIHTGNNRYSAVEGKLSKKGEVYSSGLVLIRLLEQRVLGEGEDMLIQPSANQLDVVQPKANRSGIEKFVTSHKAFPHTESTFAGKIRIALRALFTPVGKKNKKAEKEIQKYIDVLVSRLGADPDYQMSAQKQEDLKKLLKDMTLSNPNKRPSLEDALKKYETIFS
ncbi:MAG: hypothetical protein BGO14_08790 [Chlamydiales bacterium 38-26]|nr:protein kinase family protein [Chlamydiales bacterium]OJV11080.1 MAG: hypothetical protein BGO14_08790 [Chlamydiales bacterium 38-26]